MKLPFSFATGFIFRLVLPGLILAIVFVPVIDICLGIVGYPISKDVSIPIIAVLLGWLLVLIDMPIYMIFEGRRYWPDPIRAWGIAREGKRLERLESETRERQLSGDQAAYVESALKTAQFPLSQERKRVAIYPTRLGNLIAEYEQYPDRKYGMDGVFYWYRIWVGLPKDLRDELDERQALVDSAVYIAFVLYLSALLTTIYALLSFSTAFTWLPSLNPTLRMLVGPTLALWGYLLYRASLLAHGQYGHYFKAMFDRHLSEVKLEHVLSEIAEMTHEESFRLLQGRKARMAAWRYLQWDKVRLPGETINKPILEAVRGERDAPRP